MPVGARGKNREGSFTTAEEFDLLLAHLRELVRTEEVPVYADPLMATQGHLRMQAPTHEALGRPRRWVMPETARAFHTARGRRGHCWERRYRSGLVEADTSALAARRSLERTAVRAGRVNDPTTYEWSSCAAYALGTPHRGITVHPRSLALRPDAKGRPRQSRSLLAPSAEPQADARDARWTTPRAVGSPAFMTPYVPRRGRRRIETMPSHNHEVTLYMVSGTFLDSVNSVFPCFI